MRTPLVVIGAGGAGRETLDIAQAMNRTGSASFEILGVLDDAPRLADLARLSRRFVAHLGAVDHGLDLGRQVSFAIGIADPQIRRAIDHRLRSAGLSPAHLVHPDTTIGSDVSLGTGAVVAAGVRISTGVRLGRQVHIAAGTLVGHDTDLGDFSTVCPGAVISGNVTLEEASFVGAGAVVLQQLRVARGSIVGAAACVVDDVLPHVTVKGVPAR